MGGRDRRPDQCRSGHRHHRVRRRRGRLDVAHEARVDRARRDVRHHLIDPATGLPATSGLAGVTVITGQGWHAEVLAKAAFLAGPEDGAALLAAHDAAGVLITDDGGVHEAGDWARFAV